LNEIDPLINYGDLCWKIIAIKFEPNGFDFHELLGQLSRESDAEGRGMISAIVVHARMGGRVTVFSPWRVA